MPFLRFSRDARGYESTYLCHTFRRSSGPPELRVLYWFRSPPDVKVGRPALAPDVIRAIEESNPTLRFDWDKILKVKPPPPPDPGRAGRDERRPRRRRGKDAAETKSPATSSRSATPSRAPSGESAASRRAGSAEVPAKPAEAVDAGGSASDLMPRPGEVGVDTDEPLRHVALAVTDDEGLARLRARYAEIQTRIGDRFRDPARLEDWGPVQGPGPARGTVGPSGAHRSRRMAHHRRGPRPDRLAGRHHGGARQNSGSATACPSWAGSAASPSVGRERGNGA